MKLNGITVCVDYAAMLEYSFGRWKWGLDRLVVVTSTADVATQQLCRSLGASCHVTDIFYAGGAFFNKGAALEEAIVAFGLRESGAWMLAFDADIVPPVNWRAELESARPVCGKLYGSGRWGIPESPLALEARAGQTAMKLNTVAGFFMLFCSDDPALPSGLTFERHWPHAGNYDTAFVDRWPVACRRILPLKLLHLGEPTVNWCGKYNREPLARIFAERRRGRHWRNERLSAASEPASPAPAPFLPAPPEKS